jgi:hypothetical protein
LHVKFGVNYCDETIKAGLTIGNIDSDEANKIVNQAQTDCIDVRDSGMLQSTCENSVKLYENIA